MTANPLTQAVSLRTPAHAPTVSVACFLEATYWLAAPGAGPARAGSDAGSAGILAWGAP